MGKRGNPTMKGHEMKETAGKEKKEEGKFPVKKSKKGC